MNIGILALKKDNIEKIKTLDPVMQKAVITLYEECQKIGIHFDIVSARRTFEEQEKLYKLYGEKYPTQIMLPGESPHQFGMAIDIKIGNSTSYKTEYDKVAQIWKKNGKEYYWGGDDIDEYWHFSIE